MKNWDVEIKELRDAYVALQMARGTIKEEVKNKHKIQIQEEIAERIREAEYSFAKTLKTVKERSGIPVTVIQDHVFLTKAWALWTKWRDLADIDPEQVSAETAREARKAANAWYSWNDDYTVLTVFRTLDGEAIPLPFKCRGFRYVPRFYCEITEFEEGDEREKPYYAQANRLWGEKTYGVLFDMVQPVVEAAIADGLPVQILRDERK